MKKCIHFQHARRTYVHVGDFHFDSGNGILSSYVSALVPCARNATIKKKHVVHFVMALRWPTCRGQRNTHRRAKQAL